jgi:exonuclease SbcD
LKAAVDRVKADWGEDRFHLLLAHEFLMGGTTSDSERPLSVGGNQAIPYGLFADFDYTALGHLHRAQRIGRETIRYAGGLYPYSFSEAGRVPSVEMIEIGPGRSLARTRLEIPPKRTLKTMEGTLKDVLAQPETDDYLSVRINDREVILDLMGKLRDRFPNTLRVERGLAAKARAKEDPMIAGERESTQALFERFFKTMTDEPLSQPQKDYLHDLIDHMEGGDQA